MCLVQMMDVGAQPQEPAVYAMSFTLAAGAAYNIEGRQMPAMAAGDGCRNLK